MATPTEETATLPRRIPRPRGSLYASPHTLAARTAALNQWRHHPIHRRLLFCEEPTLAVLIRLRDGLKRL
jgi:hypothetical protein